ncbi:MAG: hypothetical protein HDR81_01710 [Bacteroides sp.]|nr:hypothetical protein [Bacteroides sp.]
MDKYLLVDKSKEIIAGVKDIESVTDVAVSEEVFPAVALNTPSKLVEKALDSAFNSNEELTVKKAMSAALIIAKRKGLVSVEIPEGLTSISAASMADEAFTRIKAAYQNGIGKIDIYKQADIIIDRATARLLAVSDIATEKAVDAAIKVGEVISAAYPPLRPVVKVARVFQPFITDKAQKLVKVGIQKLNTFAKKTVKKVVEKVADTVRRVLTA